MMGLLYQAEFWVFVSFVIFVGLLGKRMWLTIVGMLDSRAERVRQELSEAQRLREDAAKALADYQKRQEQALAEAEAIVARAHVEAENLRLKAEADLDASLRRREQQALDRIAQMEANAVAEVRNLTVDLAVAASRRLLAEGITLADQDRLIERAIAEIPKNLH